MATDNAMSRSVFNIQHRYLPDSIEPLCVNMKRAEKFADVLHGLEAKRVVIVSHSGFGEALTHNREKGKGVLLKNCQMIPIDGHLDKINAAKPIYEIEYILHMNNWLGGEQPNSTDAEEFTRLEGHVPDVSIYPNAFSWFSLV